MIIKHFYKKRKGNGLSWRFVKMGKLKNRRFNRVISSLFYRTPECLDFLAKSRLSPVSAVETKVACVFVGLYLEFLIGRDGE